MNREKLEELIGYIREKECKSDYRIELYYKGQNMCCIYGDGDFDTIEIDERGDYILVHTDTIGILCDEAIVESI